MRVDFSKARNPEEEYAYWYGRLLNYIDEKLPWDMHPNEIRAEAMYKAKLRKKVSRALDLMLIEDHT